MASATLGAAALGCWQAKAVLMTWTELSNCGVEFWAFGHDGDCPRVADERSSRASIPLVLELVSRQGGGGEAVDHDECGGLANPLVMSICTIVMPTAANWLNESMCRGVDPCISWRCGMCSNWILLLAPWLFVLLAWPHSALITFSGKTTLYGGPTVLSGWGFAGTLLQLPMTVFGDLLPAWERPRATPPCKL